MFADNTCLLYTGDNLNDLSNHVNNRLKIIAEWCAANKLSLNPSKCSYMLFTTKNVDRNPLIELDGSMLEKTTNCRYLGMQIDENLKYNDHIELLCTKMAKMCGISYRLIKVT